MTKNRSMPLSIFYLLCGKGVRKPVVVLSLLNCSSSMQLRNKLLFTANQVGMLMTKEKRKTSNCAHVQTNIQQLDLFDFENVVKTNTFLWHLVIDEWVMSHFQTY